MRLLKGEWEVHPVGTDAFRLVERYHYAQGGSNTATFLHGLFRRGPDQRCYGVAWWIPPTKGAAISSWDGDWQKVLSLTRLVIVPGVPLNACTFLLARSVCAIRADGIWRCLVTYADTWRGHTGGIYRAAGWEYLGLTKPESVWVDADGRMVSRKAGPVTRTKVEMEALGYRCVGRFAKHKYRKILPAPRAQKQQPTLFDEVVNADP